jgi:serine/threonine-protein kinase
MRAESERDERLMTLVAAALEQASEMRDSFLRSACGDDLDLYTEVSDYVLWDEKMSGFLCDPVIELFDFLDRPFEPGELIADRFRVLNEVGRGGMGVVYEAHDEKLDRCVALKAALGGHDNRLPPEVRAAREVSHFNVCKVYELHSTSTDLGEVEFLVMEYIEGETLSAHVRKVGPLSTGTARDIAAQICAGLAQAHRQGVIHGDLKCGNIILSEAPGGGTRAVITDFGLAAMNLPGKGDGVSQFGGSLDYMAPELFSGERPSAVSDVYALGVILYEMLTGRVPAPVKEPLLSQDARTLTLSPSFRRWPVRPQCRKLPRPWGGIVARCLDPDPAGRFQNVEEIATRLEPPPSRRHFLTAGGVLAVASGAGAALYLRTVRRTEIPSIAVIPLAKASDTPESAYLSDGLSEGLINTLARLPNLKVIARSSSFQFKREGIQVREVAAALGVQALVTTRVVEHAGRLRITAELVNGADGMLLWGAQYSPGIAGLADVQAEICREIAEQIPSKLSSSDRLKLADQSKVNPQAYELFLRGRYQVRLHTPESSQKVVGYYQQALAVDPGFAQANAELAYTYRMLSGLAVLSPSEMIPKAEAAALRALAVDEGLAEAHAALADIRKDQWNWAAAEHEYRRAIELSPNLSVAHDGFAIYLSVVGRHDGALAEIKRTRELDPIGIIVAIDVGAVCYNARRYGEALEALKRAVSLDPTAPTAWTWMGIVYAGSGEFAKAIEAYEKAVRWGDNTASTQCLYAYSLARSGRRREALQILDRMRRSDAFVPLTALAFIYCGLNQPEAAMQVLEAAYASREPLLQYMKVEPHYDVLRMNRRFQQLAARIGLPP